MDKKKLREIISVFRESGLAKMEVSETTAEETFSLKLESAAAAQPAAMPVPAVQYVQAAPGLPAEEQKAEPGEIKDYDKYRNVKSPMVGIFYTAPSPEAEPFVKVGSKVKKGDTLCIIEAMKLMNDVVAEEDGEIVEICAENGSLVEFGQILFKIF
ncbi:MAG TPA: acetyl-CoA carboxylase biotin carboxyl carrier protein [Candidatus Borkfalkia faecavium]|uniref:Biotin carboxyl carrier protein of acetyl-CoA carboxylase n=1 Tax=Candidatus Borkfalkia faecavium TaxID=2838508 RepID=A0A9D1W027_9FIRM|nr:acetyl-CoA carboxylase biotin carboxyl carrier protein [Candidatus Borkfalkia faecavium]